MRFIEAMAHIAVALRDSPGEYADLARHLRVGARGLAAEERKLARQEGHPIDWGEHGYAGFQRGQTGPRGGLETTPIVLANFWTGYLLGCSNQEVALQTLLMSYAATRERGRKRHFLAEFAAVLGDPRLAARCDDVGVSLRRGFAYIDMRPHHEAGPMVEPSLCSRTVFYTPAYDSAPASSFSVHHLYPGLLRPLLSLILSSPARPALKVVSRAKATA